MNPHKTLIGATLMALLLPLAAWPAWAHHGKDFLLLETDDLPPPGHFYVLGSLDTNIDKDGTRSTEITPGLLFGYKNRWAIEPHFHVTRTRGGAAADDHDEAEGEGGEEPLRLPRHGGGDHEAEEATPQRGFHYDATALSVRYRIGNLGRSEWRLAVSGEIEVPKDHDEPKEAAARLIFARTYPKALVAVNLLAGKALTSGGERSQGIGVGVLTPLSNGNRLGLEVLSRLPLRDGLEIVPGYYVQLGKSGRTAAKIGVGLFHSRQTTRGTLHVQLTQRF